MKRFLSSVLSLAFVASLYAAGVAQSPAPHGFRFDEVVRKHDEVSSRRDLRQGLHELRRHEGQRLLPLRRNVGEEGRVSERRDVGERLYEGRRHGGQGILPFIFDELGRVDEHCDSCPVDDGLTGTCAYLIRNSRSRTSGIAQAVPFSLIASLCRLSRVPIPPAFVVPYNAPFLSVIRSPLGTSPSPSRHMNACKTVSVYPDGEGVNWYTVPHCTSGERRRAKENAGNRRARPAWLESNRTPPR